jgi:hypothetical protein
MYRAVALCVLLLAAAQAAWPAPPPKEAVDDRGNNQVIDNVGKGKHMGRKPLQPGAYFNDRARATVRQYYAAAGKAAKASPAKASRAKKSWQIGEALAVAGSPLPQALAAKMPPLPPGHQYVEVTGDVLLIAAGSRMVVDAISARAP